MASRCRTSFVLLAVCMLLTSVGCSSLTAQRTNFKAATQLNPAVRCLCLWQQAEGLGPNGRQCRGFAGQVFFFAGQDDIPVTVDGDVKVYVFADAGSATDQGKPVHQANFTGAEMRATLSKTQFGPAYNLFVPCPTADYHEASCALRLRLNRPDGSHLFSDMTNVKLTGTPRPQDETQPQDPLNSQNPRRDERVAKLAAEPTVRSTTIGVERNGQMFRSTDRVRHIQIGPVEDTSESDQRAIEIEELEQKLQRLRTNGDIRQIGHQQGE